MSVIDTTNVIDNSMYLKANLAPNMVGENYYIENLQDKRNEEWEYRYNRVWIEEELHKQITYTNALPDYSPIDVVIGNVKSNKGEDLGTDWAEISFKDLKYQNWLGDRYRFSLDFPDMRNMTEEEKKYQTSIWLSINKTPITAGNQALLRRCNTSFPILGYENRDRRKTRTREVHLEPVVLETDLKYIQIYYNLAVPVPQAEWYATMQLNYFTNSIKINDRFIFGTLDNEVRENNAVYKVKAVVKSTTTHTFTQDSNDELESTPLLLVALDKDAISPQDNFQTRIANNAPIYLIPSVNKEEPEIEVKPKKKAAPEESSVPSEVIKYSLKDATPVVDTILLGHNQNYKLTLLRDGKPIDAKFNYQFKLTNKKESDWPKYFNFKEESDGFTVTNLKTWQGGVLEVNASYNIPDSDKVIERKYSITLGKSY